MFYAYTLEGRPRLGIQVDPRAALENHFITALKRTLKPARRFLPRQGVYSFFGNHGDPTASLYLLNFVLAPRIFVKTLDREWLVADYQGDIAPFLEGQRLEVVKKLGGTYYLLRRRQAA